jgi:hypothetical protein
MVDLLAVSHGSWRQPAGFPKLHVGTEYRQCRKSMDLIVQRRGLPLLMRMIDFSPASDNIVNERGAPTVTFGYLDQAKATNARALIDNAIVDPALIADAGSH